MAQRTYDIKELWELIERAKGDTATNTEFAQLLEIDKTTLSKIKNGSYKPGKKLLKKIADNSASASITLENLMQAAGYPKSEIDSEMLLKAATGVAALGGFIPGSLFVAPALAMMGLLKEQSSKSKEIVEEDWQQYQLRQRQFKAMAFSIVYRALKDRGFEIAEHTETDSEESIANDWTNTQQQWYSSDSFVVNRNVTKNWEFIYVCDEIAESIAKQSSYMELVRIMMDRLLFTSPTVDNTTIVLSNRDCYHAFSELKNANALKKNLSIVLIDMKKIDIASEVIVASYSEEMMESLVDGEK